MDICFRQLFFSAKIFMNEILYYFETFSYLNAYQATFFAGSFLWKIVMLIFFSSQLLTSTKMQSDNGEKSLGTGMLLIFLFITLPMNAAIETHLNNYSQNFYIFRHIFSNLIIEI